MRGKIDQTNEADIADQLDEAIQIQAADYTPPPDDPLDDLAQAQQNRRNRITQNYNQMKENVPKF